MEKYRRAFLLGIENAMEYRANFLLTLLASVFPIFIQFFLWTAIYRGSPDEVINGYTYAGIISYSLTASIISRLVRTTFEYEINDDIKNGGLTRFLIRPIDYLGYRLSCFIGQKLLHTLMSSVMIAGSLALLAFGFGRSFSPLQLALFALSLLFAFLLNFLIFFSVGMWAFLLTEIGFLFEAVRIVFIMLSGGIFPPEVLGPGVARVLELLPFMYTINFPVKLLVGEISPGAAPPGLLLQALWIAVFFGIARLLWNAGSRRYTAVGG